MDKTVLDLLSFYQKKIREAPEARKALKAMGITDPQVVEHFQLGYSTGKAFKVASTVQ